MRSVAMTPDELTEAREALGLKISAFAKAFHVDARSVRGWEKPHDTQWRPIPFAVAMLVKLAVKFPAVRRELGIPHAKGRPAAP